MAKKKKKHEEVALEEMNVILRIPTEAISVTVTAKVIEKDSGDLLEVGRKLTTQDIFKARTDFLDYVDGGDDYDAKFVITDEGRRWLEEMQKQKQTEEAAES